MREVEKEAEAGRKKRLEVERSLNGNKDFM